MTGSNIFNVLGGLVFVAALTTVVTSKYTASQITAAGNAGASLFASALGKGSINR